LFYTPPLRNESLTSWLYRLTNSHYCDLQTYFRERIEPVFLRNTDFDKLSDIFLFKEFTRFTPLSSDQLRDLTLSSPVLSPFDKLSERSFIPWLLPPARKNVSSFGLQICSSCWFRDPIAFHRIHWRLSLFFFCTECRVYLQNHCPACGYPIVFRNSNFSTYIEDQLNTLRFCYYCSSDLATNKSTPLSMKDASTADRVLSLLGGQAHMLCSLEDYLIVLHYFTQRAFAEYQRQTHWNYSIQRRDRSRFLETDSLIRADLLAKAFEMFDDFPELVKRTKRNHLSVKSFWLRGFVNPPEWYYGIL